MSIAPITVLTLRNGLTIKPVYKDGKFLGLGEVSINGTQLRSPKRPMSPEIRNPEAIKLTDFRLEGITEADGGYILTLSADKVNDGIMEWMLHTVRNRHNTSDWSEGPEHAEGTRLELRLKPIDRNVGGRIYKGFSYGYSYSSPDIPIYRILDRSTWEPGGSAMGCKVYQRCSFTESIREFESEDEHYSTEWYLPGCHNPSIFQFVTLQTTHQGFNMTAGKAGVLFTWATTVSHVRSLFEKPRGTREIVHWHEHCGDLSHEFSTPDMEVLFAPGEQGETELMNTYNAIRELVYDTLHSDIGMRRERVTTYGVMEEWGNVDLRNYAAKGLPLLADLGVKRIFLPNHFQNNMNVWGVSNMCCTVDLKVAEDVGEDRLTSFCSKAQGLGMDVEMWGNTSISTLTWILNNQNGKRARIDFLPKEGSIMETLASAEEPWIRNASGALEADHYTPVFACLNLRDGTVRDYWMKAWTRAHDTIGLKGIFLDSSCNLSSDKFHWMGWAVNKERTGATADQTELMGNIRPAVEQPKAILSQYRAHLDLMVAMQGAGYSYCGEDTGVFGIHRSGPGIGLRYPSLFMWSDSLAVFDVPALEAGGLNPDDVFFQGLAHRMMWFVYWNPEKEEISFCFDGLRDERDTVTPWHSTLLKAYTQADPHMKGQEILSDGKGVKYTDGRECIIWAFRQFEEDLGAECGYKDLTTGAEGRCTALRTEGNHVYMIHRD